MDGPCPQPWFLGGLGEGILLGPLPGSQLVDLQKQAVLADFRSSPLSRYVLVAGEAIFGGDPSAPLVEVADPLAALEIWSLCQETVFTRPMLLSMQTLPVPEVLVARVNQLWHADQEQAVLKPRWRNSFRGGWIIAQPAATSEQLQHCRRATASGKSSGANAPHAGHVLDVGKAGSCAYDPDPSKS